MYEYGNQCPGCGYLDHYCICGSTQDQREIPDPAEDLQGCLEGIADQVADKFKRLLPDGLPALERERRMLAMSGARYIRLLEMHAPQVLIDNERRLLQKHARALLAEQGKGVNRLMRAIRGENTGGER